MVPYGANTETPSACVAIVHCQPLVVDKLADLVGCCGKEVGWTASTAAQGIEKAWKAPPDGVIFEYALPDASGAAMFAQMRVRHPYLWGVCLARIEEPSYCAIAHAAGASAYLCMSSSTDVIARVLQRSCMGANSWGAQQITSARAWWLRFGEPWKQLSSRQRQVALGLAMHRTNKEIAADLGIKVSTVKTHFQTILGRIRVTGRDELLDWLSDGNLSDPLVCPLLGLEAS